MRCLSQRAPAPRNFPHEWEELGVDTAASRVDELAARAAALEKKIEETRAATPAAVAAAQRDVTAALAQLEALGERRARLAEQVAEQVRASTWLTGRLHGPRARLRQLGHAKLVLRVLLDADGLVRRLSSKEPPAGGRTSVAGAALLELHALRVSLELAAEPGAADDADAAAAAGGGGGEGGGDAAAEGVVDAVRVLLGERLRRTLPTAARGDDVAAGGGTQGARLARRLLGRRR